MIEFKDIQSTARDTISAAAYFAGETVVAETGISRNDIEAALTGRGFSVVVDIPIKGDTTHRAPGTFQCSCLVPVTISINPETNPSGAKKSGPKAVQELFSALLAYSPDDEHDRFTSDDDAFDMIIDDAGLFRFFLWFRKTANFSEPVTP